MDAYADDVAPPERGRRASRGALACMVFGVFFTLGVLIDWSGVGGPRGALILLPALFGMIGCALAITARGSAIWVRILWSIASLAVGLAVVPAAMVVILYVSGP